MAAQEEKILPQYAPQSKHFVQGLNGSIPPVDLEVAQSHRRRRNLRWAVAGTILTYLAFRIAPVAVQYQLEGSWGSVRPHRIPPKVAEQIFL